MVNCTPTSAKRLIFLFSVFLLTFTSLSNIYANESSYTTVRDNVASLSPTSGHAGTEVTITGSGFTSTSTVQFGASELDPVDINFINPTTIVINIPCEIGGTTLTSGSYAIDVDNSGNTQQFQYIAPEITTNFNTVYEVCEGATFAAIPLNGEPSSPTTGNLIYRWTNNNTSTGLAASGTISAAPYEFPSFTAVNSTNEPITSEITITPEINDCVGASKTFEITVNPRPVANPISNITVCNGETIPQIDLTASSPNGGTGVTFEWSRTSESIGSLPFSGTTSPIGPFTATNTGTTPLTSTFTVTPIYRGCEGNPITFTVTVNPESDGGNITASNTTICDGSSTDLTLTGQVGSIIEWQSSTNGFSTYTTISNTTNQITVSPTEDTQYRAVVQSFSCPISFSSPISITVNPAVVAGAVSGGSTVCYNSTSDLLTLSGHIGTVDRWQYSTDGVNWIDIAGTSGLTSYTSDPLTVTTEFRAMITSGTCTPAPSTATTVTVQPITNTGNLAITSGSSIVCENSTVNFQLSSYSGTIIRWEYNNTSVGTWTPVTNPSTSDTYTSFPLTESTDFRVMLSGGVCPNVYSPEVSVTVEPEPIISALTLSSGFSSPVCAGNTVNIDFSISEGTLVEWQSRPNSSSSWTTYTGMTVAGANTYTTSPITGPIEFQAIVTSSGTGVCGTTASNSLAITTDSIDNGGTIATTTPQICENDNAILTITGNTSAIIGWEHLPPGGSWTLDTTSSTSYNTGNLSIPGTHTYRALSGGGVCGTVYSNEITVEVGAAPAITDIPNQTICLNESRTFGDPPITGFSHLWTSSSGYSSNLAQPTITFSSVTTETYTHRITNDATGCVSEDTFEITVNPLPAATVISDASICAGDNIALGAAAVPGSTYSWTAIPSYTWTPPGVSSTDPNPTVSPTVTTTFTLTETTAFGCTTSNSVTITVEPDPIASFAGGPSRSICETDINEFIQANITGNYNSLSWEVVPASAGTLNPVSATEYEFTPSATGIAAGSAIVRLTVTNTCNIDLPAQDLNITIDRQSIADAGTDVIVCGDSNITLDGTASQFATTYSWAIPSGVSGTLSPANSPTPVYTPSAADVANFSGGSIPFTLTTNSGANCAPSTDTVLVTIVAPPVVNAGASATTICEGGNLLLNGTETNTTSVSWSNNGGDGTFTNPNSLTPTYVPGVNDIAAGTVTLTLTGQGNTPCSTATSDLILTIEKDPIVDLGPDTTVCANETTPINLTPAIISNAATITWTHTGNGSFNNANVPNPIYYPAASDLGTSVTFEILVVGAQCDPNAPAPTATDAINYQINTIPTADAGMDETICETQSTVQLDGFSENGSSVYWTTPNGTGGFNNRSIDNPVYTFSPADISRGSVTFNFTVSQNTCTDVTDTVVITIQKNPTANAGLAGEICQGQSFTFNGNATDYASVRWVMNGGSGTLVNDDTLSPTYNSTPSERGVVTFTLEVTPMAPCSSPITSSVELVIVPNPTADAGNDGNICEGDSFQITTANATDYFGSGGSTGLLWTTSGDGTFTGGNTLEPIYIPGPIDNNNGSVTLTLTASNSNATTCFNDASDSMTLTINKIPSISIQNPTLDVCTNAGVPVAITGVDAIDFDTLTWTSSSTGSSGFSPSNTPTNTTDAIFYTPTAGDIANGSVVLTLEAARDPSNCNSSTTATVTLNFVEDVAVDAGPATATICGDTFYTTTSASASNFSNVFWESTGSGTWTNQSSIDAARYTPSASDITAGSVTLTVRATGLAPCFDVITDTIVLNFEAIPEITTIGTDSICETGSTYPITGTSVTGNYQTVTLSNWTTNGTGTFTASGDPLNPIYNPTPADIASGNVTLTLTIDPVAPCIAPQSNTIVLTFIPEPDVSAGASFTHCETPFTITTAAATAGTYASLVWTSSGTGAFTGGVNNIINPTYEPSAADIASGSVDLTLRANPISPCAVPYEETITVTLLELPEITVAAQSPICEDDTNVLVNGTSITNALSFVYTSSTGTIINNPTSLTPTVTPSATDISNGFIELTVEATPFASCGTTPITESITIPVVRNPIVFAGPDGVICEGENITTSGATQSFVDVAGGNLLWSNNGGDGTFLTPNDVLVTTYQPGPTEIANGQVTLTLTGTASSPCATNAVSAVTYSISGTPVVTVNPTIVSICENETYQVQPGQVSITNMGSVDSVTWSASSPGTISAGGPLDLEPIFTPSAADIANGFADITILVNPVTACAASPVSETIRVNISQLATIDATQPDYTFCEGVNKPLFATYTNEDPATYNWQIISGTGSISNATLATPEFIPAADSESVTIRVSVNGNGDCNDLVFEEFTLTKTPQPEVSLATNTDTVCSSQTTYNLNALVTGTTASSTYLWTREDPIGSGSFSNPTSLNTTYTFSAADIANGSVTLRLTATSDPTCALTDFDEIVITILDEPTVTITNTTTEICENDTFAATATATDASSYLWEVVGTSDGTFTNANSSNATYAPGPNDILTGSFTLQITATGDASCAPATETITVNVVQSPEVDAGLENRESCASEPFQITGVTGSNYSSIQWTSTSGSPGSFSNDSALNPIYTPSAAEIASGLPIVLQIEAFPLNSCSGSVTDTIVLNLAPEQTVNAGGPVTICEGEDVSLNATLSNASSVYWTTSSTTATTGFTNPTSASTTYTPSTTDLANGTVTLTIHAVSDSNCAEVTDDVVVTIIKKPTVAIGAPVTICENETYTPVSGEISVTDASSILWTVSGGGTISAGTETTLTPTFVPDPGQTGTVTLTLTAFADPSCGSASDVIATKTITISPIPTVTIPATRTICQGESLVLTAAEVSASDFAALNWTSSNGLGTFAPSNAAATTYTPNPSQTGTVTLRLTATALDNSCTDTVGELVLNIEPSVTVEAGTGSTICENETFTISDAVISGGTGVFNWTIAGPATIAPGTESTLNPQIIPNTGASGVVTLTLEANGPPSCPTPVTDDVFITINANPTVDAGVAIEACEGVTSIPLSGTVTNGVSYSWTSTGNGTIQATADPLRPNYIPAPADFASPSGVTVIDIFLEVTGDTGCSNVVDSTTITLYANPTIDAGSSPISACEGETVVLNTATATNFSSLTWATSGNGTFDYTTAGGVIQPTYTLGSNDTSTVTLTMIASPNTACSTADVTDTVIINVTPEPTISVSTNEISLCGDTFTLPDLVTISNASSIEWTNSTIVGTLGTITNETTETPTISPSADEIANGFMLLTLTAYPEAPCTNSVQETIRVNLAAAPNVNAGNPITVCSDTNPITLNFGASVTPSSTSFYWTSDGTGTILPSTVNSLTPQYTPGANETGTVTFTLHAANPSPCNGETTDTVTVDITPLPVADAGIDAEICDGSSFNIVDANAEFGTDIQWYAYQDIAGTTPATGSFNPTSADVISPVYTPSADDIARGYVYLSLEVSNSCSTSTDYMRLTITPGGDLYAGANAAICEGETYNLFDATATNIVGNVSWTSAQNSNGTSSPTYSGGSFSDPNGTNPTYTPSADDIVQGYVYLILNGNGGGSCGVTESVMRLDITRGPSITVSDANICVDTPSISLASNAEDYNTISWSVFSGPGTLTGANTETPVYTHGLTSSITTVQTAVIRAVLTPNGGCATPITEDITVTIQPLPTVEAGDNGDVCYVAGQPIPIFTINNTSVSNASSVNWTSSGTGTFTSGTPTTYQSLANSCPGTEDLTLTANGIGACSASTVSDAVTLTINCEAPDLGTISSSAPTTICQGTTATYQVPANPAVTTYNWTVPTGATIVSQSSNLITVEYGSGSLSGNVSVSAANECGNGPISTLAITVNPTPGTTSISGPTTVCAGQTGVTYTAAVIPEATSYTWTLPAGVSLVSGGGTNEITVDFDITAVNGDIIVQGNNACGSGVQSNLSVNVTAAPTLDPVSTTPICSGDTFNQPLTSATATQILWSRPVISGIDGTNSGSGNINDVLINTTTSTQTVTYTITLTTATGCTNTEFVTVDVDPAPQLTNVPTSTSICSGESFNFTPTSTPAGTINWSRATISGISEPDTFGSGTINEPLTNTTENVITVDYILTLPTTINGCSGTATISIDVLPSPSAAQTITGPTTVCAGATGNVYTVDPIPNATSYEWTLPNGTTTITTSNSITVDYALTDTSGNITVQGINDTCSTRGAISPALAVSIIPPPTLSNAPVGAEICSGDTFTYSPSSSSAISFDWVINPIAGITTPVTSGSGAINEVLENSTSNPITVTYTFTLTTADGCSATEDIQVVVNPTPTLNNIATAPTEICSGDNFTYTPSSTPVGTITWTRLFNPDILEGQATGNGTINEPLTNLSSSVVTVTYEFEIVSAGCSNTETITVDVNPTPDPAGPITTGPVSVCAGSTGNVYTVNDIANATSYLWTLPNGSTETTTSSTIVIDFGLLDTSGNLTVQGINSCGSGTVSPPLAITIVEEPTLTSSLSPPSVCSNELFHYEPTTINPNVTASWSRLVQSGISNSAATGTGAIDEVLINNTNSPVSVDYEYTLTTPEGCTSTAIVTVIVNPLPTLDLVATNAPTSVCSGEQIDFTPVMSATPTTSGTISWQRLAIAEIAEASNSGSGSIYEPSLTNLTSSTVTVTYILTLPATPNGCNNTVEIDVDIEPVPDAADPIDPAGPQFVCEGSTGNTYTVNPIPNASSYVWSFNGTPINTTATNSIVINFPPGSVSGNLTVQGQNACGVGPASPNYSITVVATPTLSSSLTPPAICSNEQFDYTPLSTDPSATFTWTRALQTGISNGPSSGNGNISEILTNTTDAPIDVEYIYTITNSNNCSSTEVVTVTVNPSPTLDLAATDAPSSVCSGVLFDPINLVPSASPATTGAITWKRYDIPEIAESYNEGSGTISESLTNLTSSVVTVTYELTLPATANGCDAITYLSIDVEPAPSAPGTITGPSLVCDGTTGNEYTVPVIANAQEYIWTLPDTSTRITTTNSLTINFPLGSTSGNLTVQGRNCDGLVTGPVSNPLFITISSPPSLTSALTDEVCSNTAYSYTPVSSDPTATFTWTRNTAFGISNAQGSGTGTINETLINTTNSSQNVTYEITSVTDAGCTNTETLTVTVYPSPTIDYANSVIPTEICSGESFDATIVLSNPPATVGSISWARINTVGITGAPGSGSGPISEILTNSEDYTIPVTYEITLPPTDPNGCVAIETIVVNVHPTPTASISGGGTTCLNSTDDLITFTGANGTAPYTFEYTVDGSPSLFITSGPANNSVQVLSSSSNVGTFTYELLSVTDANGCSYTLPSPTSQEITVEDGPELIITDPEPICETDTADLTDSSIANDGSDPVPEDQLSYWTNATGTLPLLNPTAVGPGTYYIKRTDPSNSCETIQPVVVTGVPLPEITVNSPIICEGDSATITVSPINAGDSYPAGNTPGTYTYSWTSPDFSPGNVASFTTASSLAPGTYNYSVSISYNNAAGTPSCPSIEVNGSITVNPLPNANITISDSEVCQGDEATITFDASSSAPESTGPYIFDYNINGAANSVTSAGPSIELPIDTSLDGTLTYTLEGVTDGNGCYQALNVIESIEILPPPTLVITNPDPICEGDTVDLTDPAITNGSDSGITLDYWLNSDGTGTFDETNAAPGTYYIEATYTSSPSCSTIEEVVVTSVPLPEVTVTSAEICEGETVTVTATPQTSGSYDFIWTFDSGNPSAIPNPGNTASFTFTPDTPGSYEYEVTIIDTTAPFCESTFAEGTVTVNPLPTASITPPSTSEVCLNEPVSIEFIGSDGTGPYEFDISGPSGTITLTGDTTATIAVPTGTAGTFTYTLNSVRDTNTGCTQIINESVSIIVRDLPVVTIDNGSSIDVCAGEEITLTASGANSYIWYTSIDPTTGDPDELDSTNSYTFTPIISGTYYVQGTDSNGCVNTAEIEINMIDKVEGFIQAPYDFVVCEDGTVPTVTFEGNGGTSGYTFTYDIELPDGSTVSGSVTTTTNTATLEPPIPTSTPGTFTVTLTGVTSDSCGGGEVIAPNQAFIEVLEAGIVPTNLDEVNQSVCEGETIVQITFDINGSPSNAFVDGLPAGLTSEYVATASGATTPGTLTISGTPTEAGEFNYTVRTSGSAVDCNTEFQGTIRVNENGKLVLIDEGTDNQEICINTPIADIRYELQGSATDATIKFVDALNSETTSPTPDGITFSATGNNVSITGQPTAAGTYYYMVETFSTVNSCEQAQVWGTITVLEAGIEPTNPIEVNQTVCEGETIVPITFDINGTPSDAFVEGLPAGVTSEYVVTSSGATTPGTLTISGTPVEAGAFTYTVRTSGSAAGCNAEFEGTITVNESGKLLLINEGTDNQEICLNTPIADIRYELQGSATNATVKFVDGVNSENPSATPSGITFSVSAGVATITGQPTTAGTYYYLVETFSTENDCSQAQEWGTITVKESVITLNASSADANQTVCINTTLQTIDFDVVVTPTLSSITPILSSSSVLPAGLSFNPEDGTISGTPTEVGTFTYIIESSDGCAEPFEGTITVEDIPSVLLNNGDIDVEVCDGSPVTLTASGAETYTKWYVIRNGIEVPFVDNGNDVVITANTLTYIPNSNEVVYVEGESVSGCTNTDEINVIIKPGITASISGVNVFEVCKNDIAPEIVFAADGGSGNYEFTYTINGIEYTATTTNSNGVAITVPTNVAGVFEIILTDVEDTNSSTANCTPTLVEPTTALITVLDSGITPQAGAEIFQTICEGETITDIAFDILGNATNAYAEGLPSGVSSSFSNGILTISGTPSVTGSFDYTIVTTGLTANCSTSFTGNITITESATIAPTAGTEMDQTVCECSTIENMQFELGGTATGATVNGLPSGLTWSIDNNILTISGTACDVADAYTYTITPLGTCEDPNAEIQGTITITQPDSLVLTSAADSDNQIVCVDATISDITYQATNLDLVLNGALPPGVTYTVEYNSTTGSSYSTVLTISGTPNISGIYNYTIETDGNCNDIVEGSIIVEGDPFINYSSGDLNQVSCIGTPIDPIRYQIPVSSQVSDISFEDSSGTTNLPDGLGFVVANGELIISGTPTNLLPTTVYTVKVSSNCGVDAESTFTLGVEEAPEIIFDASSGSTNQAVCQNGDIVPFTFTVTPIGTEIDESLLPSFIEVDYDTSTGTYTLTGAPQSTGTFTFDIQTTGNSSCVAVETVEISNTYAAISATLESGNGSDNQTICSISDPIVDIVYDISGTLPSLDIIDVVGLPDGVIVSKTATSNGMLLTISGQPTASGIFNYEVVYDNCGTIKNGVIQVSSPMTINGTIEPISCNGNDAEITVEIFGGVPFIDSDDQPFYNISWEGPNGFRQNQTTITGLTPGEYTISVTDAIGCGPVIETFVVEDLEPLSISLESVQNTSCESEFGCANLEYSGGTGIYIDFLLEYSNPQTQIWETIPAEDINNNYYNICGLEAGLYRVSVTDSKECTTEPFLFTIENGSNFAIENVVLNQDLCNGETGTVLLEVTAVEDDVLVFSYNGEVVTANSLGNNFYELEINSGASNGIISVTNSEGCTVTEDITIETIDPDFEFTSLEFENFGYFEVNSPIRFTNLNGSSNPNVYSYIEWDFGDNTPFRRYDYPEDQESYPGNSETNDGVIFHTYTNDGIYDVTLTYYNVSGCSTSITKTIVVGKGASVMLPTVFSPNNDGVNDKYRALFRGVTEVSMFIYDNWGNIVYSFTTDDARALENDDEWGWNGIEPKETEPRNDTYRVYIIAKTLDGKTIEKTGRFLIIQ